MWMGYRDLVLDAITLVICRSADLERLNYKNELMICRQGYNNNNH